MSKYQKAKLIILVFFGVVFSVLLYFNIPSRRYVMNNEGVLILNTFTGTRYFLEPKANTVELDKK